ncbi:MAG: TauD/TfdA family dioxygenase [Chloroflexi bacterium]|nr:TauD/TfdA family dioxygenase [Chloroflexota bacterium]
MALPQSTDDPTQVRALVERDGCAILSRWGTGDADARRLPAAVFGQDLVFSPAPAAVGGPEQNASLAGTRFDQTHPLFAHIDGTAMGARRPDFFFLLCAVASDEGGESFLVDAATLAHSLKDQPLGAKLSTLPIEQTESPDQPFQAPIIWRSPGGRLATYRSRSMRPIEGAPDEEEQAELISWWKAQIDQTSAMAPRFKLKPGDALCIDNLRMMHGREPYTDPQRLLYRVWVWTKVGLPVPESLAVSNPPASAFQGEEASVQRALAGMRSAG